MNTYNYNNQNEVDTVKSNFAYFDFNIDWKNCIISDYKLAIHSKSESFNLLSYVGYDEDEWYKD